MNNPFIAFYPGKWLARTAKLSAVERGVFITLICEMYEGQIPINFDPKRLARFCGTTPATLKKCVEELLLDEHKMVLVDGALWNNRVEKEIITAQKKSENQSKKSRVRWEKSNEINKDDIPRDNPAASHLDLDLDKDTTLLSASADLDQEKIDFMVQALGITDETKSVGLLSWSEPLNWISNGCSFDHDIIPTLKAIASRDKAVNSWSYCSKAIFDAKAKREAPAPDPSTNVTAFAGYKQSETAIERVMRQAQEARDAAS
tara:strand:+ start:6433 stop:7212 length:780 start_codon:yes stop_codon:yes gene_type:complete